MTTTRRFAREAALWMGGALGGLCLLSFVAGWAFHVTPLVFASGSMTPHYGVGSLGVARQAPASELRVGDVVSVLDDQGRRVTHRIVGVTHEGSDAVLTLKGDANNVSDVQTYRVSSAPRVAFDVPMVGYVLNAAASPYGVAVTAAGVMGLLFLSFGGSAGSAGAANRRRVRTLVPVGVVSVFAVGGVAGASGAAPWAFTSAYWTDSATATVTASTPTVTLGAVGCTSSESGKKQQAVLSWTSLGSAYEYYYALYVGTTATGTPAATADGGTATGTIAAAAKGQITMSLPDLPAGGGGNSPYVATIQARLVSDHSDVGSLVTTPLHSGPQPNGPNWSMYCGTL